MAVLNTDTSARASQLLLQRLIGVP